MRRSSLPKGKDRRLFKKTASKSERRNFGVGVVPRGGFRL